MDSIIILDTNIWVYSTKLMASPLGAALASAIKRNSYAIAIPEVVNGEVQKHVVKHGLEAVDKIDDSYKIIETLMGKRDDYKVPDEISFKNRFSERLSELGLNCFSIPTTLSMYKNALVRVINGTPPNGMKNQQYKDSLIWESILFLSEKNDVHFITEDKGFFKESSPNKGIAQELKSELDSQKGKVYVYYQTKAFLDEINQSLPPINKEMIASKISEYIYPKVIEEIEKKGAFFEGMSGKNVALYLTENPSLLAVDFSIMYDLSNVVPLNEKTGIPAIRKVEGSCMWNIGAQDIENLSLRSHKTYDTDGNEIPGFGHHILGVSNVTIGRKTIKYKLKTPFKYYGF